MPSVYTSVFQNFLRSGFSKSFTHGYAQSVVAATHPHVLNSQNHPSFARRNSQRVVGRLQSLGLNSSAFHTSTQTSLPAVERRHDKTVTTHGGLDAYFENLQQKEHAEEEADEDWVQYEFQKRLEWKPKPAAILLGDHRAHASDAKDVVEDGPVSGRISPEEEALLAHVDAAIEREIEARRKLEALGEETESLRSPTPFQADELHTRSATPLSNLRTPGSLARTLTPPVDPQSQSYADHLTKLSEEGRYEQIPPVFEAMLATGVRPIAASYNALMAAAIHMLKDKQAIVTKALDVYTDMLQRKVSPDSDTYNILVGLLAGRSLEVSALKSKLEDKRVRFGGMDEPGKFMFASHEMDLAILQEDDRLDLAVKLFQSSVEFNKASYSSETYHQLISACAQAGRVGEMLQLFEHMEYNGATPFAATFPAMITAFANSGDLISAVECYNEYRNLAIAHDAGEQTLLDRLDSLVYASVINAYVISDKLDGAMKFYEKIVEQYGVRSVDIRDALISSGLVDGLIHRGIYEDALRWAQHIDSGARGRTMSRIATAAADHGDRHTAVAAFANVAPLSEASTATMALLAMSVRLGDVPAATQYWQILSSPEMMATAAFIEPAAMYAVAMIGSGQVAEGLTQSEMMFHRIRESVGKADDVAGEIEEASEFIAQYMSARGITDPRIAQPITPVSYAPYSAPPAVSSFEDTFDPYAQSTDFKASSLISDDLEGSHGRKGPRLSDALGRFRNVRRAGRHPRYITYAKLISAAARDGKMDLCHDILEMARTDVPLLPEYAVVRYGWTSILDAMVGACLTLGNRSLAEHYHRELLEMGARPSANTFGLYITTLKETSKTFDEASEAVRIFHRAKSEGVEPSSFLYNALIGKLGKARRIDDCLLYFAEMRQLNIKPTSVTYGTVVNALCRVSDEKFAEELFDEMEAMPNYKARPAPYNSMMQFFLTTKRDKSKVLAYYERMRAKGIAPTAHTHKLLVDTHATLEPVNMTAADAVLDMIRASGQQPEPVHYASLIHARGCVMHDMAGARRIFDSVVKDPTIAPNACLFQALFEAMVANHQVAETESVLKQMQSKRINLTPYIANTLIHGWAAENNISKAKEIYNSVGRDRREPSTYEAMTRAFLAVEDRVGANGVVSEMLSRGYPSAVVNKVLELLGGGATENAVAPVSAA